MADATEDEPTVRDVENNSRFVIVSGGGEAGYAQYDRLDRTVVFTHTVIDPAFEEQGLGSQMIQQALDDVRQRGERVVAQCPFVASYIRRHPAYADLVAH